MTDIQEQLTKYLTDAHSIEEQALAQLRSAPDLAGDPDAEGALADKLAWSCYLLLFTEAMSPMRFASKREAASGLHAVSRSARRE